MEKEKTLSLKDRVKQNLNYKPIEIKTKLNDGSVVKGSSISVTDNSLANIEKILTEKERLSFLKQGINILINNQDRNTLKPETSPISKIQKLLNEGKISKKELVKLLQ